jgi:hypothetical protein
MNKNGSSILHIFIRSTAEQLIAALTGPKTGEKESQASPKELEPKADLESTAEDAQVSISVQCTPSTTTSPTTSTPKPNAAFYNLHSAETFESSSWPRNVPDVDSNVGHTEGETMAPSAVGSLALGSCGGTGYVDSIGSTRRYDDSAGFSGGGVAVASMQTDSTPSGYMSETSKVNTITIDLTHLDNEFDNDEFTWRSYQTVVMTSLSL